MADWIIYFDDGSTFSDADGEHYDAPDKGVVCIACRKQAATLHLHDWYYWHAGLGLWWCSDIHGLLYQLRKDKEGHIRSVRTGANAPQDFYLACLSKAYEARVK